MTRSAMLESAASDSIANSAFDGAERRFPRVVLFDIDGTLINAVRRREYRTRIRQMLEAIFGTCGRIGEVDFAGKTDLAIYREALECEGITQDRITLQIPVIEEAMHEILISMAAEGPVFEVCAGVQPLLDALSADDRFKASLLTGNFEKLAEVKLRQVDVWKYFRLRGAFGSDAFERDHLPEIAATRFREHLMEHVSPDRFIIVGDTPRDIACARFFGARVLAVGSGRHTADELSAFSPDAVLKDLSDTSRVIDLLARI